VELELSEQAANENLRAVWVDIDDYSKFRGARDGKKDIFEDWLKQAAKGEVPPQRAPWEKAGWFGEADQWIRQQLDQLELKVAGEVQQYRVGWNASCVLAVPTTKGQYFFKAAYAKPPAEATFTRELAAIWPDHIIRPIAVDEDRNWMLNADYTREGTLRPDKDVIPEFAAAMARIQIESAAQPETWENLNCPVYDLGFLQKVQAGKDQFLPHFLVGDNRLTDEELRQFSKALMVTTDVCEELKAFALPNTLVHRDFRLDNLVQKDDSRFITDWAGTVVGHPFFVMNLFYQGTKFELLAMEDVSESTQAIKDAYLNAYVGIAPLEELAKAFQLAHSLFPLWRLCYALEEIEWVEKNSPRYWHFQSRMQVLARDLIALQENQES